MTKTKTPMRELIEVLEVEFNKYGPYRDDVSRAMKVAYSDAIRVAGAKLPAERKGYEDAYNQGYRDGEFDGEIGPIDKDVSEFDNASKYFTENYEQ